MQGRTWRGKDWLFAAALVAAVFLAYQPAWHGRLLWDDEDHVTRPELRSWQGLGRIWSETGATLQYYPLLHSSFWVEYKLWGDSTLGYHLVNLVLHSLSALMVAVILRRLAIPGALLAAAIFALHPVHVESVAWITEQKNTLSGAFYLGAMLAYLRFDETRKFPWYLAAFGLFALGMMCKTVIATLPGAMLVIFWWQRGRLSWKNDVLPLAPFFLLGAGGGIITAWWELKNNKSDGPEFCFSPAERLLIAGRAVWFYLWKLVWPTKLTFFYPRWSINAYAWPQYLYPFGAAALLAVFVAIRRWTRAPLAAALFFGGTLIPVLGFFSLYTFRYSLVANHYQYLASLGIITLASAGIASFFKVGQTFLSAGKNTAPMADGNVCSTEIEGDGVGCRYNSLHDGQRFSDNLLRPLCLVIGYVLCLALLATLATLTWRQSGTYADAETLYRTTIEENPECWLAYHNLGWILADRGKFDEAIPLYQQSLKINPNYELARNNLGIAWVVRGRLDKAVEQFQKAVDLKPDYAGAYKNLGMSLFQQEKLRDAIVALRRANDLKPEDIDTLEYLGMSLAGLGQLDEAIVHFQKAVDLRPDCEAARRNLNIALTERKNQRKAQTSP